MKIRIYRFTAKTLLIVVKRQCRCHLKRTRDDLNTIQNLIFKVSATVQDGSANKKSNRNALVRSGYGPCILGLATNPAGINRPKLSKVIVRLRLKELHKDKHNLFQIVVTLICRVALQLFSWTFLWFLYFCIYKFTAIRLPEFFVFCLINQNQKIKGNKAIIYMSF